MRFKHQKTLPLPHVITNLASFDGDRVIYFQGNTVYICANGKILSIEINSVPTVAVFLSSDRIAIGNRAGQIEIWSLTDQVLCLARQRHEIDLTDPVTAINVVANNGQVASLLTGHESGKLNYWLIGLTLAGETCLTNKSTWQLYNHPISHIVINHKGRFAAVACNIQINGHYSHSIAVVNWLFGKIVLRNLGDGEHELLALQWSNLHPSEVTRLTGLMRGKEYVRSLKTFDITENFPTARALEVNNDMRFTSLNSSYPGFIYSQDQLETYIYTINNQNDFFIWDSHTGALKATLKIPAASVIAITQSPSLAIYALARNGDIFACEYSQLQGVK
jgi:hypothetical protein